jgi:hypothetical protein
MITSGIRLNTKLKAVSQYVGLNFSSLCKFNGVLIGSNDSGMFEVDGDTDNTVVISSYFKTFSTDFGVDKNKNIRSVAISGVFPKIDITTVIDNTEKTVYKSLQDATLEQKTVNVNTNHADAGKYIGLKVSSDNGSDFSVDAINVVIGVTQKLNFYEAVVGRMKADLPFNNTGSDIPMLILEATGG